MVQPSHVEPVGPIEEIPDHQSITREIRRTLEANRMVDGVHIRLTLTRGPKIT